MTVPPSPALFPEYTVPPHDPVPTLHKLLMAIFSPWTPETIEVVPLTGGITNKLYKATHTSGQSVLIRTYGQGTETIIDRDREIATHKHLYENGLAPPLYARFSNGLVYAYVPGVTAEYPWLSNPLVARSIARKLGQWHRVLSATRIEEVMESSHGADRKPADIWELMLQWAGKVPEGVVTEVSDLEAEISWARDELCLKGGREVVAHCDLLAGNVILPEKFHPDHFSSYNNSNDEDSIVDVQFIDYEYTMAAPRAFDLANHFMEWQGFECKTELIPEPVASNPVLRSWAKSYLGSSPSEKEVGEVVDQVLNFWGMPGLYWGIWAAIQSSISDLDFDYASYANLRLKEYTAWKAKYSQHKAFAGETN